MCAKIIGKRGSQARGTGERRKYVWHTRALGVGGEECQMKPGGRQRPSALMGLESFSSDGAGEFQVGNNIHTHTHTHICTHTLTYTYIHTHMYIYTYIHMHTHTHIHICIF